MVLVDGDIGTQETAAKTVAAATPYLGTIDVLVNNAGVVCTKPFTEFTTDDVAAGALNRSASGLK
jgi:NAD(P)-dependent dehydrogenase (short-subunit alcohol dehydrogenase family)